ncbi:GDSL esterase/lipase EXL3-like protein [Tanacetum coccineum]|uniref:GDSL esterase/lipase EXL3-like protein n=1 Tax=Tanacetum coccineum TaxID=301880 RepID=A0ABQ5I279_9ASTR
MMDQLQMFANYIRKLHDIVGRNETDNILNNSLFFVATGSDDLVDNYFLYPIKIIQYDIPSYASYLVSKASAFIKELHGFGARRIVILSLPPVGCMPTSRTLGGGKNRACARLHNQAAKIFNKKLSAALDSLRSKSPPVNAVLADIYSPLLDVIENPQSYGNLSFQIDVYAYITFITKQLCVPLLPSSLTKIHLQISLSRNPITFLYHIKPTLSQKGS